MLTWEEDVEVSALHQRGWSISAIARHLGRSRTTVRAYVRGERRPGERRRSAPDLLAPYLAYGTERLRERIRTSGRRRSGTRCTGSAMAAPT